MSKTGWSVMALAIVVVAVVVVFIVYLRRRPKPCEFSEWKRSIGVELDTSTKDLQGVKAKLGITDDQVRQFDDLRSDYALKYDMACQDYEKGAVSNAEYACLRGQRDRVLDQTRKFKLAVEAAKQIPDARQQKDIILKSLQSLQAESKTGCTSAISVSPHELHFAQIIPELSVHITNGGNNDFNFFVADLPAGFGPIPESGMLSPGRTASIVIQRVYAPVSPRDPIIFHVRTNLQDDEKVEITLDSENRNLWKALGEKVKERARSRGTPVDIKDAVDVVTQALGNSPKTSDADRYVLASTVLFDMQEYAKSQDVLNLAKLDNPSLAHQGSTLILQGLLANRERKPNQALQFFAEANESTSSNNAEVKSIPDLLAGTVLVHRGDTAAANKVLSDKASLRESVAVNPSLTSFAADKICSGNADTCQSQVNKMVTAQF